MITNISLLRILGDTLGCHRPIVVSTECIVCSAGMVVSSCMNLFFLIM